MFYLRQISSRGVASIPTAQVFPSQFPADFSILAAFKANPNSKSSWLVNIYSAEGDEVFSIKLGRKINMKYQGITTSAKTIKFGASLNDGRLVNVQICLRFKALIFGPKSCTLLCDLLCTNQKLVHKIVDFIGPIAQLVRASC